MKVKKLLQPTRLFSNVPEPSAIAPPRRGDAIGLREGKGLQPTNTY